MNDKAAHVRRSGQTRNHTCHWPGCTVQCPPAMWGCRPHWFLLPKGLRDLIWSVYEIGQEINMTPSREYVKAARQVQDWIELNYPEAPAMVTDDDTPILGFRDGYRYLSNFYPSPMTLQITINGETGPCDFQWNEQWYMFHKSEDIDFRKALMRATSPAECKRIGRTCTLRPDWDVFKDWVMLVGLRAKFNQSETLAEALVGTGRRYLEETNTWGDRYWGVDRYGHNMLGILLMQVRAELQTQIGDFNDSARMSVTGETLLDLDAQDGCPND